MILSLSKIRVKFGPGQRYIILSCVWILIISPSVLSAADGSRPFTVRSALHEFVKRKSQVRGKEREESFRSSAAWYAILSMNLDGSNRVRLTETPFQENHVHVSPDGTKILFSRFTEDLKGDVNDDTRIDITDVLLCVNVVLGLYRPTLDEFWRADFNDDGVADILGERESYPSLLKGTKYLWVSGERERCEGSTGRRRGSHRGMLESSTGREGVHFVT